MNGLFSTRRRRVTTLVVGLVVVLLSALGVVALVGQPASVAAIFGNEPTRESNQQANIDKLGDTALAALETVTDTGTSCHETVVDALERPDLTRAIGVETFGAMQMTRSAGGFDPFDFQRRLREAVPGIDADALNQATVAFGGCWTQSQLAQAAYAPAWEAFRTAIEPDQAQPSDDFRFEVPNLCEVHGQVAADLLQAVTANNLAQISTTGIGLSTKGDTVDDLRERYCVPDPTALPTN